MHLNMNITTSHERCPHLEEVPIELLNKIGVLQFEQNELELVQQTSMMASGNGI